MPRCPPPRRARRPGARLLTAAAALVGTSLPLAGGCGFLVGESIRAARKANDAPSEAAVNADPESAYAAARGAVDDLGFEFVGGSYDPDALRGKVVARTAQDVTIETVVKGESDTLSRVSVKAGTFGNDPLQAQVLRATLDRLTRPAPAADPRPPEPLERRPAGGYDGAAPRA